MAKTMKAEKVVKTTKPAKKEVPVMETANSVKVEDAPTQGISPAETAKSIVAVAKQSDQYEFDDRELGRAIFEKLPPGEFVIQEGNKTVIQKL